MNRFPGIAAMWWSGRTLRERRLLMVMVGLLFATLIFLGVVRPVLSWRAAAADRAEAASATLAEARAAVAALGPVRPRAAPPAEGLEPLVRRTAAAVDLDVVTLMSASGQLGFQLSRTGSGSLFVWLAALETDHGLVICSLGVTENADATLNVEGSVSVGACTG
jgi:general secretion pathway protein M